MKTIKQVTIAPKSQVRSFTLLELIIVIVIIGILATLGFTQYTMMIEKGRTSEALAVISTMRTRAYEYYLKNGTTVGLTSAEVGANPTSCTSTNYFSYQLGGGGPPSDWWLGATRCTSGGKSPNYSSAYLIFFRPDTNGNFTWNPTWHCCYPSSGSCTSGCMGYQQGG